MLRPHLTLEKLSALAAALPKNKAKDLHGFSNEILHLGGEPLISSLQRLFQLVARTGYVPADWRMARVVPVPKTKSPSTDPKDFRPISVLPVIRRLYEKVLTQVVRPPVHRSLSQLQFGFRQDVSTLDAVLLLDCTISLLRGMANVALLDIRFAFDSVPHALITKELEVVTNSRDIAQHTDSLLASIVHVLPPPSSSTTTTATTTPSSSSLTFVSTQGTPQGSGISPDLHNVAVNPVVVALNQPSSTPSSSSSSAPSSLHLPQAIFFADDQCLVAPTTAATQDLLNRCESLALKYGFTYNVKKSVLLPGAPTARARRAADPLARHHSFLPPVEGELTLNQNPLPLAKSALYLGIPIQAGVGIDGRALAVKNALSAQRASSVLHYLVADQGIRDVPLLRKAYLTYVRPCLFYGSQIARWTPAITSPLSIVENRCFRTTLAAPRSTSAIAMAYLLRIVPVTEQASYLASRYAHHLNAMPDDHPLKAACLRAHAEVAGTARTLLITAMSTPPPVRIKDSPAWWTDLCNSSNSSAAKTLVVICPPNKAHHKLLLSIKGEPGHHLRLWLLHRVDAVNRCNPDPKQLPQNLLPILQTIYSSIHRAGNGFNQHHVVRLPSGDNLDALSLLIKDVLESSDTKKNHLHDIGRVIYIWARHLNDPTSSS